MFGRKGKNAQVVDPNQPAMVKLTLEDGSYKTIMVHPYMRISDVIDAVLAKTNETHNTKNYAVAIKEKGAKGQPIEIPHSESARALVGPEIEAVYLREVVTVGATAARRAPAALPASVVTPQQSYDDADDPMYDQIPDFIAGKGGGADYTYDERTMPAFKTVPSMKSPILKASPPKPPGSPLSPPPGDLHWGEGYLMTGGKSGLGASRIAPARSSSLKHRAQDVPDLSSDSLYSQTPPSFLKQSASAGDVPQYDENTLPAFKGDIPPPPTSPPPPTVAVLRTQSEPSPISRPKAAPRSPHLHMKATEEYTVIGDDDDDDWEDVDDEDSGDRPTVLIKVFIAKRSYAAADDDELSFSEGEQIFVARQDDDGWWLAVAQSDGSVGYVPNTFLMDEPIDVFTQEMPEELVGMDDEDDEDDEDDDAEDSALDANSFTNTSLSEIREDLTSVVPQIVINQENPVNRRVHTAGSVQVKPTTDPIVVKMPPRAKSIVFANTVSETDADTGNSAASALPPPPTSFDELPPPPPDEDYLPPPPEMLINDGGDIDLPPPPADISAGISPPPPRTDNSLDVGAGSSGSSFADELMAKVAAGGLKSRGHGTGMSRRRKSNAFSQQTFAGFSRVMSTRKTAKKPTGKTPPPVAAKPVNDTTKLRPAQRRRSGDHSRSLAIHSNQQRTPNVRPTPKPRPRSVASRSDAESIRPPPLPQAAPPPLPSMPPPTL